MPGRTLTIEQVLTLLSDTPRRLAAATEGLTAAQLRAAPGRDGWSANDVLAHLRSCSDMWGGAVVRIIDEDEPTLRAVNPRTWILSTDYLELEFRPSFDAFAAQRADLLAALERLPLEGWARSATVTGGGADLERTVLTYGQRLARHERSHCRQVESIAAALRS